MPNDTPLTDTEQLRWLSSGDNFAEGTKQILRRSADKLDQLERELAQAKADLAAITPLKNKDIRTVIKLSTELAKAKLDLRGMTEARDEYAKGFETQSQLHAKFAREAETAQRELTQAKLQIAFMETEHLRLSQQIGRTSEPEPRDMDTPVKLQTDQDRDDWNERREAFRNE